MRPVTRRVEAFVNSFVEAFVVASRVLNASGSYLPSIVLCGHVAHSSASFGCGRAGMSLAVSFSCVMYVIVTCACDVG